MKITFLIRSLDKGGAERQLVGLAIGLKSRGHEVEVLTFYPGGHYAAALADASVRLTSLDKRGRWDIPAFLWRLRRRLAASRPDVLHSYLGEPNLMALVARSLRPRIPVIWGVRASAVDLDDLDLATRLSRSVEFPASRFADLIIANSDAGRRHALNGGMPANRTIVIENGIDPSLFVHDPHVRRTVRRQWGVDENSKVIGMVSRLTPMKGYEHFIEAAALTAARRSDVRFVCVGHGRSEYVERIRAAAVAAGVAELITWIDEVADSAPLYSGFDLYTSTSIYGEGFSNSIGEAMACGLPCVVTDVGDAAKIVGSLGRVVIDSSAAALSAAWLDALEDRDPVPIAAHRAHIVEHFSVEHLVSRTEQALMSLKVAQPD